MLGTHEGKHGTGDIHLAEQVAKRVPNCKARFVDDAGHYSLPIRHMREILKDLICNADGHWPDKT